MADTRTRSMQQEAASPLRLHLPAAKSRMSTSVPSSARVQELLGEAEEIVVTEADLRRCGGDLALLRHCSRKRIEPQAQEDSPRDDVDDECYRSRYDKQCRAKVRPRDPWLNKPNPEERRARDVWENFLSEPYFPPAAAGTTKRSRVLAPLDSAALRSSSASTQASSQDGQSSASPTIWYKSPSRRQSLTDNSVSPRPRAALRRSNSLPGLLRSPVKVQQRITIVEADSDASPEGAAGSWHWQQATRAQRSGLRSLKGTQRGSPFVRRHVWLAVDKESGEVSLYPIAAAERLDRAYRNCRKNVPLAGLREDLDSAIVHFGYDAVDEILERDFSGAEREARRIEIQESAAEVRVNIALQGRFWAFADPALCQDTVEVSVPVTTADMVRPACPEAAPVHTRRQTFYLNHGVFER